ncbi:hypothetical protein HWV62_8493 [Athelia sp. TMB]|nr:hypothetical protein HWV62_8493 [Athelia sp. TMB]
MSACIPAAPGAVFSSRWLEAGARRARAPADFNLNRLVQAAVLRDGAGAMDQRPIDDAADYPLNDVIDSAFDYALDYARGRLNDDGDNDEDGDILPSLYPSPPSSTPTQPSEPAQRLKPAQPSGPAQSSKPAQPSAKAWRLKRDKRRKKEQEARRRDARAKGAGDEKPARLSHHLTANEPLQTELTALGMVHTATGYQGMRGDEAAARAWTLDECVEKHGHTVMKWDGEYVPRADEACRLLTESRTPIPIQDPSGRIFAVCAGRPGKSDWDAVSREAAAHIQTAREECRFPKGCSTHQRGPFPAMAMGVSFGGGQKQPGNLAHSEKNRHALKNLLHTRAIRRIANFGSSALAFWCPRLHRYYCETLGRLFKRYPLLHRNFNRSVFPCITVNFGPHTCCYPHRDSNNLPYGLCAITALGSFDPTRGGHLVLWDLRLIIEFPAGSTILVPSATVQHSNIKIQEGETRYSFTQYAAGGLFRWVEHGFKSERDRKAGWSPEQHEQDALEGARRWEEGVALFSTLDELRSLHVHEKTE